jgi:hypothetical protein
MKTQTLTEQPSGTSANPNPGQPRRQPPATGCRPAIVLALLAALGAPGCATITRGTTDQLAVESDPAGAQVTLSNGQKGITPASFTLPRKDPLTVTLRKDGYQEVTVKVNPEIGGGGAAGLAGNVLIGGVVGAIIDPASGAIYDLKPNPVSVKLVPSPTADGAETGGPVAHPAVTARF